MLDYGASQDYPPKSASWRRSVPRNGFTLRIASLCGNLGIGRPILSTLIAHDRFSADPYLDHLVGRARAERASQFSDETTMEEQFIITDQCISNRHIPRLEMVLTLVKSPRGPVL